MCQGIVTTMSYVRPTPRPCSVCGELVVSEYGTFSARDYDNGVLTRHHCLPPVTLPTGRQAGRQVESINEANWPLFREKARRLFDASYRPPPDLPKPKPEPPPAAAPPSTLQRFSR